MTQAVLSVNPLRGDVPTGFFPEMSDRGGRA